MAKKVKKKTSGLLKSLIIAVIFLGLIATLLVLPVWKVNNVIVNGNLVLPSDYILEKAAISNEDNIFFLNYRDITKRIKDIPQIKNAWVSGSLPSSVLIKIEEREPFAVAIAAQKYFVVDDEGIIINPITGEAFPLAKTAELPTVVGLPKEAIKDNKKIDAETMKAIRTSFKFLVKLFEKGKFELEMGKKNNIAILIDDYLKVKLGDFEDIDKKLFNLSSILSKLSEKRSLIEYIDLRAVDLPAVKFKK